MHNAIAFLRSLDQNLDAWFRRYGLAVLQISLGGMFLWFGALKIVDQSPFVPVLNTAFRFQPLPLAIDQIRLIFGVMELTVGVSLLLPIVALPRRIELLCVRAAVVLLLVQLGAMFAAAASFPFQFFFPTLPYVTVVGEFLVKQIVFVAAAMVIAGHLKTPPQA